MIVHHPEPETLALFESGDLPDARLRSLAVHVTRCAECQNALGEMARVREMLQLALPEPETDELTFLRSRVLEGLRLLEAPVDRRLRWVASAMAAAAVLAIALVSVTHRAPTPAFEKPPSSVALPVPHLDARSISEPVLSPVSVHRVGRRSVVQEKVGMRAAAVLLAADGSSRLRIRTADPNVVILLPMDEDTNAEKN